jgi:Ca-activated chloride channel family protein
MCDHYRTLGLEQDATKDEIRDAYFEAARQYHPDANPDPDIKEKFLQAQQAYEVLIDPVQRAMYDASLEKDQNRPEVAVDVVYSSSVLTRLDEPQLVYAMVTVRSTVAPDSQKRTPASICLVVDRSTSMKGERLEVVKRNILKLFDLLDADDTFCLITFNDRAEIVIPPTLASNLPAMRKQIAGITAEGGTEIYQGLIRGYETLTHTTRRIGSRHLVLLTDGHTYGDETTCYSMARQAAQEGVVIHALGIGHEWNDSFLDRLTSLSGGSAQFISKPEDLHQILDEQLNSLGAVYANQVKFMFEKGEETTLRTLFRLSPEAAPLSTESPVSLGNLDFRHQQVLLLEFLVTPQQQKARRVDLARGEIHMNVVGKEFVTARVPCWLRREVSDSPKEEAPPDEIMKAVSRLTLYRLQGKARTSLVENNVAKATRYLQNLATHLLSQGDTELAKSVLKEAEVIQETGHFSKYGDKNLKYGTRALMLPFEIFGDGN